MSFSQRGFRNPNLFKRILHTTLPLKIHGAMGRLVVMMLSYLSANEFFLGFRNNISALQFVQCIRRSLIVVRSMKSERDITAPKRPSLFKSIRVRKQISTRSDDQVSKVGEMGDSTVSAGTVTSRHMKSEESTLEPTKITVTKTPKIKVIQENISLESQVLSAAIEDELDNIFNEGSDYIDKNSIILTSDEQVLKAEKRERVSRKPSNLKPTIDENKIKEIQELIEKRFDHRYHREFDEVNTNCSTSLPS